MIYAAFFVQARHADLRREAHEAGLARIARKANRPRPIRVIGAALSLIRALNRREGFGFADGFLPYHDGDRWPSGVQEDDDIRWRWRGHAGTHEPHPATGSARDRPRASGYWHDAPSNPCCAGSPTS
jgi:hypothetical protein